MDFQPIEMLDKVAVFEAAGLVVCSPSSHRPRTQLRRWSTQEFLPRLSAGDHSSSPDGFLHRLLVCSSHMATFFRPRKRPKKESQEVVAMPVRIWCHRPNTSIPTTSALPLSPAHTSGAGNRAPPSEGWRVQASVDFVTLSKTILD